MSIRIEFDSLYRDNYRLMTSFAGRFITDSDACQDIVSDVFEDVWRNYSSLDDRNIKSYLFTSVRNKCIDYLRRSDCHSRYVVFVEQVSARYIDTERYLEHKELVEQAHSIVDSIGPRTSDILYACYVEGKKYNEVADEMGMSIANVKKHMTKALRYLSKFRKKASSVKKD